MRTANRYFHLPALRGRAGRGLLLLLSIDLLLAVTYLSLLDRSSDELTALFHLDFEKNIPAYYSALKLVFAGLAVFACAAVDGGRRFIGGRLPSSAVWLPIGAVLVLMGYDEYRAFHEGFGRMLYDVGIIAPGETTIAGYAWPWTVYGGAFALVVGAPAAYLTWKAFARQRYLFRLLLTAGLVFVAGALGFENIRVYMVNYHGEFGANILMVMEELCEMLAVSLAVFVFLRYREERLGEEESVSVEMPAAMTATEEPA